MSDIDEEVKNETELPASMFDKPRKTVWHLQKMKAKGEKIVQVCPMWNDPLFSMFCEYAGVDVLRYIAPGETSIKRGENMVWWTREIRKLAPTINLNAVLNSTQTPDNSTAYFNAVNLLEEGADSVLIMGITLDMLKFLSDRHVPNWGHVGILSGWQTGEYGGYRRVGKTARDAMAIYRQAYEYQENGMAGMTIEMTPREVTDAIAKKLRVPVISVAAGGAADGCEMVHYDLFGLMPKPAKHAKVYGNLFQFCVGAYGAFAQDVRSGGYPQKEHGWGMEPAELDNFMNQLEHTGVK